MKLNTPLAIFALTACFAGPDHESLGDQAYAVGEFADALVEYRLALRREAPNDILRAKAAQSAYNANDLVAAAEEFRALAVEAPDRATEAADGLELLARAARHPPWPCRCPISPRSRSSRLQT